MITVAELCAWGLPSILIPLPTAAADHQTGNARAMETGGGRAACCCRASSTRRAWAEEIGRLFEFPDARREMAEHARKRGRPEAARDIADSRWPPWRGNCPVFGLSRRPNCPKFSTVTMDLFAADDSRPVHFMGIGGAGMSALGAPGPAPRRGCHRMRHRSRGRRRPDRAGRSGRGGPRPGARRGCARGRGHRGGAGRSSRARARPEPRAFRSSHARRRWRRSVPGARRWR